LFRFELIKQLQKDYGFKTKDIYQVLKELHLMQEEFSKHEVRYILLYIKNYEKIKNENMLNGIYLNTPLNDMVVQSKTYWIYINLYFPFVFNKLIEFYNKQEKMIIDRQDIKKFFNDNRILYYRDTEIASFRLLESRLLKENIEKIKNKRTFDYYYCEKRLAGLLALI
jgi:hypothetical protein